MQALRFLHIPKTAGTTFSRILINQYSGYGQFVFTGSIDEDKKNFWAIPKSDRKNIKLVTGHAPLFSTIDFVNSLPTVTFLRDPVERVKSFCQHVSEGKSAYLLQMFPPENFDLDKLLNSNVLELRNLQTKMLVNSEKSASALQESEEESLKQACDNLFHKVSAFGLLERFDESVLYFQKQFRWKTPYYSSLNKKNDSCLLKFEAHHLDKIIELNQLDILLYKQAVKEFNTRTSGTVSSWRLKRFRKKNKSRQEKTSIFSKLKAITEKGRPSA